MTTPSGVFTANGYTIDLRGVGQATSTMNGLVNSGSSVAGQLSSAPVSQSIFGQIGAPVGAAGSLLDGHLNTGLNGTMTTLGTTSSNIQASTNSYVAADQQIAALYASLGSGGPDDSAGSSPGILSSMWQKIQTGLQNAATNIENGVNNLETGAENAVNFAASLGNAIIHNPGADAGVLGGGMLMTLGAGGEVGGVALDATGAGAIVGVPVNVVSAGVIASGATMSGVSSSYLLYQAATTNKITVFNTSASADGGGSTEKPAEGPAQSAESPGASQSSGNLTTVGDPVDIATGNVVLDQVDVLLPGVLPLVVARAHRSGHRTGRWLGRSWVSSLDQRLEVTPHGVFFAAADGSVLAYPHPAHDGEPVWPASGARWPLARDAHGYTVTDPRAGTVRRFEPRPGYDLSEDGLGELPLVGVCSRAGHQIAFGYGPDGAPVSVTHDGGYRLNVEAAGGLVRGLALAGAAPGGQDLTLVRYSYDEAGNLAEVTHSCGVPMMFCYDQTGRLVGWQDSSGGWYRYYYDAAGRCVRGEGPDGALSGSFSYDPDNLVTTHADAAGAVTVYQLTAQRRVAAVTDPLGNTTRSEYDSCGQVVSRTDPLGRVTSWEYDQAGNITAVTRADGSQAAVTYNELSLPARVTGPDGAAWEQEYDERGNLTRVTGPDGAGPRYGYDERGNLAWAADPAGAVLRVECNPAGLPVTVTAPDGARAVYQRDALGRMSSVTGPDGQVTRLTWTTEGRLAAQTFADGTAEQFGYDGEGHLVSHTSPAGGVTRYGYGCFGQLTSRTGPDGTHTEYAHDHALRLTGVTHGGLTWQYAYDAVGRLAAQADYNGAISRYAYDAAGQLTAKVNATGQQLSYAYDLLGNLIARDAGGVITTFGYDPAGRLIRAANPDSVIELERDPGGRVLAETCNGRTIHSGYDALGRRVWRVTPSGAEASWEYDVAGRPVVLSSAGHELRFGYDSCGREILRQLPGGASLVQDWDVAGQLAAQVLTAPAQPPVRPDGPLPSAAAGGRVLQRRAYSYREDGVPAGIDDLLTGPRRLTLDPAGKITAVTGPGWAERYGYDPAGNITAATWPARPASPVPAAAGVLAADGAAPQGQRQYAGNLITSAGHIRYQHDRAGRIILRQRARLSRKPDTWRYEWDASDHLTAVTTPDGSRWQYTYDPLGRRIAKQRIGPDSQITEHTTFTWDGPVLAEQATSASHVPTRLLTWDYQPGTCTPLTQAESWLQAPQDQVDRRFYAIISDLIGTPAELVSPDGELAGHQQRSLWGTTCWRGAATPLRFPGQYEDPETGLHYNHHRYYDPAAGRYLSPDPLGLAPAPNPRTYVLNPTVLADPLGLSPGGGGPGGAAPGGGGPGGGGPGGDPRFIVNSSGQVLDTSKVTIPDGKFNYLLENPSKSGVFSDSMGFDKSSLDSSLRNQLTDNFGNISNNGPMLDGTGTQIGQKFSVTSPLTGPSGQTWNITTPWGVDFSNGTTRLITSLPAK